LSALRTKKCAHPVLKILTEKPEGFIISFRLILRKVKMNYRNLFALGMLINGFVIFSQEIVLPETVTMYVNSKEGLRQRIEPSRNSVAAGTLRHGQMIWVDARSGFTETIDGITSYWYRTWGEYYNNTRYDRTWVFGGYLSQTLPLDIPSIVGIWDVEGKSGRYLRFTTANSYSEGDRDSSFGLYGEWKLARDELTIVISSTGHESFAEEERETIRAKVKIVNRNNLILMYQNGHSIELKRSSELP
jgi:hypothetical protein